VAYQAEYIWIDGTKPTPLLRNKTKILDDGVKEMPIWGFDGSSTEQATGESSDCVLQPVFTCPDPIRGGKNVLVLCEVLNASDLQPHVTNTRALTRAVSERHEQAEMIYGIEQEYTMMKPDGTPLGFPAGGGFPAPQGPYYCGVGTGRIVGREVVEEHTQACLDAGLAISGTERRGHARAVGVPDRPVDALTVSDHLTVARWLLHRIAEDYDVVISFAAKPQKGDWNGAGAHTNFSTKAMREDTDMIAIKAACEAIGRRIDEHVSNYGDGIKDRLTGAHETAPWSKFSYGVSHRGASIRIPWQVGKEGKGLRRGPAPERQHGPVHGHPLILESVCADDRPQSRAAAAQSVSPAASGRKTEGVGMLDAQRDYVLRTVEERGVRLIRLWFTDVLGNLKSFAISPAELENALEDGMTFDGSSIDGFSRIQESDVLAIPDPNTFEVLPWGDPKSTEARVFCDIHALDGTPFEGDPAPDPAPPARGGTRSSGYTFFVAPDIEFFYFAPHERGAAPVPLDEGGLLRPHDVRRRRQPAQADDPHARDDEHPRGVQLPRGRAEPARDRPAHTDALTMADSIMTFRLVVKEVAAANGVPCDVHAEAARGRPGQRDAHAHVAVPWRRERVLRRERPAQPVAGREAVHGGSAAPRRRDHGDHEPDRQQLQAARARLRGAGARQLGAQQPSGLIRVPIPKRGSASATRSSTGRRTRRATRTSRSP
jgi:glutamine synthetase